MPVNLMPLACPKCVGQLHIPSDAREVICDFCGTQIAVDDGAVTVHVHSYDEAELRRLELEQRRREEEERSRAEREERRKKWRIALVAYLVVVFGLSSLANLVKEAVPPVYGLLTTAVGFVALVGGVALFLLRPGKGGKRNK